MLGDAHLFGEWVWHKHLKTFEFFGIVASAQVQLVCGAARVIPAVHLGVLFENVALLFATSL